MEDIVILSYRNSNEKWNMFAEPRTDSFQDDVKMLARSLFPVHSRMSEDTTHSQICAQRLYEASFIAMKRMADEEGTTPTNKNFIHFVVKGGVKGLYNRLSKYGDLDQLSAHISPRNPEYAQYVYSTFIAVISDTFYGDFAKSGDFSVREYMRDPRGKTLLLDMKSSVEAPIFRLLIDCAIEHALVNNGKRKFFLLDDFQWIPHLQKLEELVNTGGYYHAETLCSLRSAAQLQSEYDHNSAESILDGFSQIVAHRTGDNATAHFVRSKIGPSASEWKVQHLDPGYAYSICGNGVTFNFQVMQLEDPRNYVERVYAKIDDLTDYVLPVVGKARLVDFSRDKVKERMVESLRYRRDYPILVVGDAGFGKTTTLKVFASQQYVNPDEPKIVFNFKQGWKQFYRT